MSEKVASAGPGSFAVPSCFSLDSAGLEGIFFCPSAVLPGESISKIKLMLETTLLFFVPQRTGVCGVGGGRVKAYKNLRPLEPSKDRAITIMKLNHFILYLSQKHVCEQFVQVTVILVVMLNTVLSFRYTFSGVFVFSVLEVLLQLFKISYLGIHT